MGKLVASVKDFFTKGHQRSLTAKKNVVVSFFIKCGSVLVSFLNVPLAIKYVNPTQYGVWLTLSALFIWFSLFDIGFGNGLKNKLTRALAAGDERLARIYISTTYFIVSLISAFLFLVFLISSFFLDWARILNVPAYMSGELGSAVLIVFSIFTVQFVLQLLNIVCLAKQNTIITSLISFGGNLLGLIIVFIMTRTTQGSLLMLCLSIGISPLLVLLIFSIVLFSTTYKNLAPSFRLVKLSYARDILNLGVKFFIIQVGLIFYYNCDNLIITQILGPQAVTPYNIAFRYFGVISIISTILMTPFWTAFIEADIQKDHTWIRNTIRRLEKMCLMIFLLSLLMLGISPYVYKLWLGNEVIIPFSLSAVVAFYSVLLTYRTIFNYYMNSAGKVMIQLYLVIFSGIVNIPLGIWLCRWMGATGVLLSTTLLCVISAFFEVTQYKKLINNKATGVWNR